MAHRQASTLGQAEQAYTGKASWPAPKQTQIYTLFDDMDDPFVVVVKATVTAAEVSTTSTIQQHYCCGKKQ
jgi:hypothetical protein